MEKRIVKITKNDLENFYKFVNENDIKFKVKVEVYTQSIYFNQSAHNFIDWWVDGMNEKTIKALIDMINSILLDCELKYTRRRK